MPEFDAHAAKVLGAPTASAIEAFMASLGRQQPDRGALEKAIAGIACLHPAKVARADTAIGLASCNYRRRSERSLLGRFFLPRAIGLQDIEGSEYLLICSRDGYHRQAALETMEGALGSPFYCALVEWRCNDWVPQVRKIARKTAERCFAATEPGVLAETLFAVLATRKRWERTSLDESPLFQSASRDDVAAKVAQAIGSAASGPGTTLLSLLLRFPTLDPHLDKLSRNAVQPGVRALATKVLIDGETRWIDRYQRKWIDKSMGHWRMDPVYQTRPVRQGFERRGLIERALDDSSVAMRSTGLQALIDHMPESDLATTAAHRFKTSPLAVLGTRASFLLRRYAEN